MKGLILALLLLANTGFAQVEYITKFGRNPDIDTGTVPEDVFNGNSTYTGFNATAGEELRVVSASTADVGALVSSGTLDTLVNAYMVDDDSATFVTDGVAVGDVLINDSQSIHGIINAVTETRLQIHRWVDGSPRVGDSYRVATASSTGAAVVKYSQLLDSNYARVSPVYAILNGTTNVDTSGRDILRAARGQVILAGSAGSNAGAITASQATTTANVFSSIPPTFGQTTVMAWTVPRDYSAVIRRARFSITRSNGSAGSATALLDVRRQGEAWRAIRALELSTSSPTEYLEVGGAYVPPATDIKATVVFVSDNNTVVETAVEMELTPL